VLPCVDVFVADEFCFWATILRTCLALRWGAQLAGRADVPCVYVADVRWGAQLVDVPCVALGRPTCGRALRCVGAPNLRTCLVLCLGAHLADMPCIVLGRPNLGEAVLKSLPPSQNLFLSILQLVF
jgi:hypothetical protein